MSLKPLAMNLISLFNFAIAVEGEVAIEYVLLTFCVLRLFRLGCGELRNGLLTWSYPEPGWRLPEPTQD